MAYLQDSADDTHDDFLAWLIKDGRTLPTAEYYARLLRPAMREGVDLRDLGAWDLFAERYTVASRHIRGAAREAFLGFLADQGDPGVELAELAPEEPSPLSHSHVENEVREFSRWLSTEEGLSHSTVGTYAYRVGAVLRWQADNPSTPLRHFLDGKTASYKGLVATSWKKYRKWRGGFGEVVDEFEAAMPSRVVLALGRLVRGYKMDAKVLNQLTWGHLDFQKQAGIILSITIPIPDQPGTTYRPLRGRQNLDDVSTLWEWAAPPNEDAPLIPKHPGSMDSAGVRRINKWIRLGTPSAVD